MARTSEGAQELANFIDPASSYSEIRARLEDVEQALHHMSREPNSVQKSSNSTLCRNRNVVIHGIPKPFMKGGEQRERAVWYQVVNLLRTMETQDHVAIKRVFRLKRWQGVSDSEFRDPQPTLVGFAGPRYTARLLAAADRIKTTTRGRLP